MAIHLAVVQKCWFYVPTGFLTGRLQPLSADCYKFTNIYSILLEIFLMKVREILKLTVRSQLSQVRPNQNVTWMLCNTDDILIFFFLLE